MESRLLPKRRPVCSSLCRLIQLPLIMSDAARRMTAQLTLPTATAKRIISASQCGLVLRLAHKTARVSVALLLAGSTPMCAAPQYQSRNGDSLQFPGASDGAIGITQEAYPVIARPTTPL